MHIFAINSFKFRRVCKDVRFRMVQEWDKANNCNDIVYKIELVE